MNSIAAGDPPVHEQLVGLVQQYEGLQRRLAVLSDRLSDAQWATRHQPGRWSPAECIVHLNMTSKACLPLIELALDAAAELPPSMADRYRRDPLGWLISVMTGPLQQSGRLRLGAIKTTAAFEPAGDLTREVVLTEFAQLQEQLVSDIRESEEMPIDQVMLASPFDPRLKYSLYSLFCILPRHQLRHLVQAERVWSV